MVEKSFLFFKCDNVKLMMFAMNVLTAIFLLVFMSLFSLAGCASLSPSHSGLNGLSGEVHTLIPPYSREKSVIAELVKKGVEALRVEKFKEASQFFGRALRFEPQNSYLHFLNALSYHLMAETSDPSQYQLAEIGYKLSIQFDPNNWRAAQQLAHLYLKSRMYPHAREYSAYALLYKPDNIDMLYGLAAASYYTHDIETAITAIKQAERLKPDSPSILHALAVMTAASGQTDMAGEYLSSYKKIKTEGTGIKFLEKRLSEWQRFHEYNRSLIFADAGKSQTAEEKPVMKAVKTSTDDNKSRMVIVDVILIRAEETATTSKGVNLLEGLTIQFGGSIEFKRSSSKDLLTDTYTSKISERILSGTVTLPAVTYSLNIFNSVLDRYDVIARPTLIALDGQRSEFFSGDLLYVGLTGENVSNVHELPIGVQLVVTPKFLSDDMVQLSVEAGRSFFEIGTIGTFKETVWTSKKKISANVVLKFGQTLVLGGLSERERQEKKSGVPLLKSIPVIQYLFSNEETLDFNRSDLILLTPRKASPTKSADVRSMAAEETETKQESLEELRKLHSGWFTILPNMDYILKSLKNSQFYREFRYGDIVADRWWGTPDRLDTSIKEILSFLLY